MPGCYRYKYRGQERKRRGCSVSSPTYSAMLYCRRNKPGNPKPSAMLQAMQERTVTVANTTYKLPAPFFVLATQNPIEMEGTYPLPKHKWIDFF